MDPNEATVHSARNAQTAMSAVIKDSDCENASAMPLPAAEDCDSFLLRDLVVLHCGAAHQLTGEPGSGDRAHGAERDFEVQAIV